VTADTPTSNAGHRDSARQREYARLPFHAHGSYAHDTVSAHMAADLWTSTGTEYIVSGDQSLRVHGTLGMRRAGRPGQWLTTQSRRRDARRMIAAGRLPHPLTVDELTRLGLTEGDNQAEVDADVTDHEQHIHDTNPE